MKFRLEIKIMLQSMTGYGRCEKEVGGYRINIELKSVNNRFADFSIKLPRYYAFLEAFVREYLKGYISRGKVDVFIRIDKPDGDESLVSLNRAYAESYVAALKELRDEFSLKDDISVSSVARNSDVFSFERVEEDEELLKNSVKEVLDEVMQSYVGMRKREGERLKRDIEEKLGKISENVALIEKIEPEVVKEYRQIKEDYKFNPDIMCPDDPRVSRTKEIIDTKLSQVDKTIILLYADCLSYRKLGRKMKLSHMTIRREVLRIKKIILEEYNNDH